jgi:hypothetical protein
MGCMKYEDNQRLCMATEFWHLHVRRTDINIHDLLIRGSKEPG